MREVDIKKLIPQRDPVMMVDRVTAVEGDVATTSLIVRNDNYFIDEDGLLAETGLIEHIAQSASAFAGYRALEAGAAEPPVGYIGEVKKFHCYHRPHVGDELCTTITMGAGVGGITIITGETCVAGEVMADTQMKIFVQDAQSVIPGSTGNPTNTAQPNAHWITDQVRNDKSMLLENKYYQIKSIQGNDTDAVFHIAILPSCDVYRGHFPGDPVCPGVCNIETVKECTEHLTHQKMQISTIKQCRLTAIASPTICPEMDVAIHLSPTDNGYTVTAQMTDANKVYMEYKGNMSI